MIGALARRRTPRVLRWLAAAVLIAIAFALPPIAGALESVLGPDATLRRGYSITRNERGKLIRSVTAVRPKMKIQTRVADGEFKSTTN